MVLVFAKRPTSSPKCFASDRGHLWGCEGLVFRLPGDIYDIVLYDFSEAYTFSEKLPLRVNSGKPRPLERIAKGERERVKIQIEQR